MQSIAGQEGGSSRAPSERGHKQTWQAADLQDQHSELAVLAEDLQCCGKHTWGQPGSGWQQ
eukprot:8893972-Prorocentrum_lima.AAC.1